MSANIQVGAPTVSTTRPFHPAQNSIKFIRDNQFYDGSKKISHIQPCLPSIIFSYSQSKIGVF